MPDPKDQDPPAPFVITKLRDYSGSLVMTIPRDLVQLLNLQPHDRFMVSLKQGQVRGREEFVCTRLETFEAE